MRRVLLIMAVSLLIPLLFCSCSKKESKNGILNQYKNVILKQYTGYDSGVKEEEYYLFLTQEEIDNFSIKKENELKHPLPITDTPKITPDEICLFVFMGVHFSGDLIVNTTEEQNKIVYRVDLEGYQTYNRFDSKGNIIVHSGPDFGGSGETPFGYFILPKTNKKIVIQRNNALYKGEEDWYTVKEFNSR